MRKSVPAHHQTNLFINCTNLVAGPNDVVGVDPNLSRKLASSNLSVKMEWDRLGSTPTRTADISRLVALQVYVHAAAKAPYSAHQLDI